MLCNKNLAHQMTEETVLPSKLKIIWSGKRRKGREFDKEHVGIYSLLWTTIQALLHPLACHSELYFGFLISILKYKPYVRNLCQEK